jgi:hypothetical protein
MQKHKLPSEDAGKGQKIVRAYPVDKSSAGGESSLKGKGSFGGSITNLSHSLGGASANQKGR